MITVARKPLSESSVAANVLEHGCGAINVEACRIGQEILPATVRGVSRLGTFEGADGNVTPERAGRWPANLIHNGSPEVVSSFPETSSGKMMPTHTTAGVKGRNAYGKDASEGFVTMETYGDSGSAARFFKSVAPWSG